MKAPWLLGLGWGEAFAQDYAFPTSLDDYTSFYPTAYRDNGGNTDWDCQSLTYPGHEGSDFGVGGFEGMDAGRDVVAAADGTVIATNDGELDRCTTGDCYGGGGFGNYVYLEHADGKVTIYGHLKQWSVLASVGDSVVCGQKMGEVGSSGYSTGPHLHFQVNNTAGASEDPFDGPCSAPPSYWLDQGVHGGLPGLDCGSPSPCLPAGTLSCGDILASSNDGSASTSVTWRYGCSDFVYTGPEMSWTFRSPLETEVALSLTGLTDDLDLYIVGSTECAGNDCVASSTNPYAGEEGTTFVAAADTEYVIVVDGWEGAVSPFTLSVACDNVPASETGDTAATESTATESTGEPPGDNTPSQPKRIAAEEGCGCTLALREPLSLWIALAVCLRAQRMRRSRTALG